jgi:hypothetical protein
MTEVRLSPPAVPRRRASRRAAPPCRAAVPPAVPRRRAAPPCRAAVPRRRAEAVTPMINVAFLLLIFF